VNRRTSGEIINATLLEVFIALVFIIFALAVWKQRQFEVSEQELVSLRNLAHAQNNLADSVKALLKDRSVRDSLTKRLVDSLKYTSREPANCEPDSFSPEVLSISLRSGPHLEVTVNRNLLSHKAGTNLLLAPGQFETAFADVRTYSSNHLCYYRVRVRDKDTSKAEYKTALAAIYTTFRPHGFLQ
jgi:hypothetical protein